MSYRIRFPQFCGVLAVLALTPTSLQPAEACTRILWNKNKLGVIVGRTMDWATSTDPILTVFPRGLKRDGGRLGPAVVVKENPLTWTSKYGSLVTTMYGIGTADGLNERGLAAHMLYLPSTDFGPRNASKLGVQAGLWAQYLLDQAATVTEALALMEKIQLVMVEARGSKATVHVALEDASGDSAILEYVNGQLVVHHGREYCVMTNDPTYDEQLKLAKEKDFSNPSSDMPLPGNVNPRDRFQRATYFLGMLPEPKNEREAVASMFSAVRNVSVPFGAPYKNFGIYNTEYRTVTNLTTQRYFFELTTSPNVIWADLTKFKLDAGSPVRVFNPEAIDLSGDVTAQFKPLAKAPF